MTLRGPSLIIHAKFMLCRRLLSTSSAPTFSLPLNIRQLLARRGTGDSTQATSTTVSGWIRSIRKQKHLSFAVITDGSTAEGLQAVLVKGKDDDVLKRLTNGAAVQLTGQLLPSPGSGQSHELLVDEMDDGYIKVLGECDPESYPIQKQSLTPEYLRDHVHLRARTSHIGAMLRLRDTIGRRINSWFESHAFCHVNTPILTSNDAEGAGETFRLSPMNSRHPDANAPASPIASEFFSVPAFLTVSHQLHLEALATALSRVYTLSPCFRAEPSDTSRHLAEFWMLEAEWAFPGSDGVHGVCNLTEALLRDTVADLLKNEDINLLLKDASEQKRTALTDTFSSSDPWTSMSYTNVIKELEKASATVHFAYKPEWGRPLQSEHERWLAEILVRGPVFVTDYPACIKPFYMRVNADEKTVACFDLLVPHVGELIGGSVREERYDVLETKMRDAGLLGGSEDGGKEDSYQWYLDLRRDGGAPHAGFGMGFERLVSWVSGIDNVRECIPMPRWAGRMLL